MPVNDPTSGLPWWASQGAGVMPGGGVMGYQGATPGAPQGASWLQYLAQMFGPGAAQAGEAPNPTDQLRAALAAQQNGQQQNGPPVLPTPPIPPVQQGPGYLGSSGAGSGDPRGPDAVANQMNSMAPGTTNPGYQPPGITPGPVNPNVPAANAQPVKGPLAPGTGGAGGQGAMSNPRFTQIDRPNAPAGGSPYGRGGGAQMSALNLAGLFNRGGPGAIGGPAAAPQGGGGGGYQVSAPGAAAIQQGLDYTGQNFGGPVPGPLANAPLPPKVARARMLQPNYYS